MNKGILKFVVLGTILMTQTVLANGGKCPSRAEEALYYAKAQVEANRARDNYQRVSQSGHQGRTDVARFENQQAQDRLRSAEKNVKTMEFLRSGQR